MPFITVESELFMRLYSIGSIDQGTNNDMKTGEKMPVTVPSSRGKIDVSSPRTIQDTWTRSSATAPAREQFRVPRKTVLLLKFIKE